MQLTTFSGRAPSQRADELLPFIDLLSARNVRSYLEVGARHGDTFHAVMSALPAGSVGVSVDLPGAAWGRDESRQHLIQAAADLRAKGYRTTTIFGDSRAADIIARAAEQGPFDAILIDGDHRYEGVTADWQNYGGMAPIVAFHDIVGHGRVGKSAAAPDGSRAEVTVEVPRFWSELKAAHRSGEFIEFVGQGSAMGIGVICK
jgi:predicted O-methyltransferase YrrM